MADWDGDALAQALREAAKEHATGLARERSATREALQRAQQAEAALRALPEALQRAAAAEMALRTLQDKLSGELVGSDAKALLRELISSFNAPESMVSSASATQAASEAASAGWEAANAAAIADHDATADLFGMELATVEASIFSTATQLAHERERAFTLGEDLKAAQAHAATVGEQLELVTARVGQLEEITVALRGDLCSEREAMAMAEGVAQTTQAELLAQRRRCRRLNLRLLFERAAARQQRQQAAAGARGAVRAIAQAAHARATRQALRLQVASELHALGNLSAILAPAALLAQPQPLVG